MDDIKAQLDLAFEHPNNLTSSVSRSDVLLGNLYTEYKSARDTARRGRLDALRKAKDADEASLTQMSKQLQSVLASISECQAQALELRYEMAHLAVSIDAEQAHIESLEALVTDSPAGTKPSTPTVQTKFAPVAAPTTPGKPVAAAQAPITPPETPIAKA
jgi:septal ring factor EnvC (AmiA/AmiB activator)